MRPLLATTHRLRARALLSSGQPDAAGEEANRAVELLEELQGSQPGNLSVRLFASEALRVRGDARAASGQEELARSNWRRAQSLLAPVVQEVDNRYVQEAYARASLRLGEGPQAAPICAELRSIGWDPLGFQRLCREHGL